MIGKVALAGFLATGFSFASAHAATEAKFDEAQFSAAQKAGRPILVEIDAGWCPICAKQRPSPF